MTPDRVPFYPSLDEAITFEFEQGILRNRRIARLVAQLGHGGVAVNQNENHPDVPLDDPSPLQHGFLARRGLGENQIGVDQVRIHFSSTRPWLSGQDVLNVRQD